MNPKGSDKKSGVLKKLTLIDADHRDVPEAKPDK